MTNSIIDTRSEKGVALVIVLLLMAVLSGLATGFAMNGQVESAMAVNEVYYAGARAAAEAGINRVTEAIRIEENVNLLSGVDGVVDDVNIGAAVNNDNGQVGFLLTAAPYTLDPAGRYTYTVEIFDDDDPELYDGVELSDDQLAAMGEVADTPYTDVNTQLIIRATGRGPSNTVVRLSRMVRTTVIPIPGSLVNPAIIVDGDLAIDGNLHLEGDFGSVHANGDLDVNGNSATVEGDATASGEFTANQNFDAGGAQGGNYASINLPLITASDYQAIADYRLNANGTITDMATGLPCLAGCPGAANWSHSDPDGILGPTPATWSLGNGAPGEGTYYVEGKVSITGSPNGPGNSALKLTLIATGSISISGNPKLSPDNINNPEAIQFVTDGDLSITGNSNLDPPTQVEGQIFVKEQIHMHGNPEFQGRIIVQNEPSVFDDVTVNSIGGTPTITYNGTLPGYVIPPTVEFTYNVGGWVEQ